MATYEYRCRECGAVFEARRPMARADEAAVCPAGHDRSTRLLSVFASTGGAQPAASGGCCGGACGCG